MVFFDGYHKEWQEEIERGKRQILEHEKLKREKLERLEKQFIPIRARNQELERQNHERLQEQFTPEICEARNEELARQYWERFPQGFGPKDHLAYYENENSFAHFDRDQDVTPEWIDHLAMIRKERRELYKILSWGMEEKDIEQYEAIDKHSFQWQGCYSYDDTKELEFICLVVTNFTRDTLKDLMHLKDMFDELLQKRLGITVQQWYDGAHIDIEEIKTRGVQYERIMAQDDIEISEYHNRYAGGLGEVTESIRHQIYQFYDIKHIIWQKRWYKSFAKYTEEDLNPKEPKMRKPQRKRVKKKKRRRPRKKEET